MVNFRRCKFFSHVKLLTFIVVKLFQSNSNWNSVIFIWSSELASTYPSLKCFARCGLRLWWIAWLWPGGCWTAPKTSRLFQLHLHPIKRKIQSLVICLTNSGRIWIMYIQTSSKKWQGTLSTSSLIRPSYTLRATIS